MARNFFTLACLTASFNSAFVQILSKAAKKAHSETRFEPTFVGTLSKEVSDSKGLSKQPPAQTLSTGALNAHSDNLSKPNLAQKTFKAAKRAYSENPTKPPSAREKSNFAPRYPAEYPFKATPSRTTIKATPRSRVEFPSKLTPARTTTPRAQTENPTKPTPAQAKSKVAPRPRPDKTPFKPTLSLILAALMVGIMAGCKPSRSTITLRVATWGDPVATDAYTQSLNQIYQDFEKDHPGVKIEREVAPDQYVTKMVLDHAAHDQADVLMLDASSAALFINNHLVQNLRPQIQADPSFHLSDFYPNTLAIANRGEAVYAIPQDFTPIVVFYDKSKFRRYHVPLPNPNWNFNQFLKTAQALNHPPQSWGFIFSNWMPGWVPWLWNNGGDVMDLGTHQATGVLNSPANIQTFAFLNGLVNQSRVSPSPSAQNSLGIDLFANGQGAMTISGHWSLVSYKQSPINPQTGRPGLDWQNLGVAPLPHNTPTAQTVIYESGYAESAQCRYPKLAWEFIKYMTSFKVQWIYNQSGIAVDARKDVAAARASTPIEKEFLGLISHGRAPYGSLIDNYSLVEPIGQSAMEAVMTNGVAPSKALKRAANEIDHVVNIP